MNTTTIDRKQELIDRARPHYHTKIYLPDKNEYISGLHCKPNGVTTYRINEIEPVVPPYAGGDSFDGWIVLPILGSSSAFTLVGSGFEARARLQIRASAYFVA